MKIMPLQQHGWTQRWSYWVKEDKIAYDIACMWNIKINNHVFASVLINSTFRPHPGVSCIAILCLVHIPADLLCMEVLLSGLRFQNKIFWWANWPESPESAARPINNEPWRTNVCSVCIPERLLPGSSEQAKDSPCINNGHGWWMQLL